jgi:hypothetical protein
VRQLRATLYATLKMLRKTTKFEQRLTLKRRRVVTQEAAASTMARVATRWVVRSALRGS